MLVSDQREWVRRISLSCGNFGRMSGGKYPGEMSWGFHRHHSTLNVSKLPIGAGLVGMCEMHRIRKASTEIYYFWKNLDNH